MSVENVQAHISQGISHLEQALPAEAHEGMKQFNTEAEGAARMLGELANKLSGMEKLLGEIMQDQNTSCDNYKKAGDEFDAAFGTDGQPRDMVITTRTLQAETTASAAALGSSDFAIRLFVALTDVASAQERLAALTQLSGEALPGLERSVGMREEAVAGAKQYLNTSL